MSEYTRFSELTGIAQSEEKFSYWPLNTVLVLLGASILTTAFYFLDPQDPRILYNPWTYAVATPVALLVLSVLLSLLVSRIIEKSMQTAFLLSVLVHLILLIYAMNVVIFSRMWPDILESIAQERHQLERESLQANQYFRVSTTSQNGRRPDYLSYVPTRHQPTELEKADSPALQLARSEQSNLVSPVPEIERSANPHIWEREQHAPSMPAANAQAASLSRSESQQRVETQSTPQQLTVPQPEQQNRTLQPSLAEADRRQTQSNLQPLRETPLTAPNASSVRAERADDAPRLNAAASQASRLDRAQPNSAPRRGRALELPQLEPSASPAAQALSSNRTDLQQRTRNQTTSLNAPALQPSTLQPRRRPNVDQNMRRNSEWRVPQPSAGNTQSSLSRNTAGGRTGPPQQNSMPVLGAESLAGQEVQSTPNLTPLATNRRRSETGRQNSSGPAVGAPQAPTWNNSPSLAGGTSGRSPAELATRATDGDAAAEDIASMSGAGNMIERSQLGLPANRGVLSQPSSALADSQGDSTASQSTSSDGTPSTGASSLTAEASQIRRGTARGSNSNPLEGLGPATDSRAMASRGVPRGLNRATGSATATNTNPNDTSGPQGGLARSDAVANAAPARGEISIPNLEQGSSPDGSPAGRSGRSDTRSDTRGALAGSNPLRIDALPGQGGVTPSLEQVGALLPRRSTRGEEMTPVDLDAQRFARQRVGGPLATGQRVAVPTPAFQQRLERLQDRDPLDNTSAEPQTELAIERGLAFLAKHQREDGSWRLEDFDTKVLMTSDTAATALALLAFQGAGYTHKQFKYAEVVDKALEFLKENQKRNGDLYIPQDPASDQNAWLYSHGIASLAMCEAYGMTQDPELRPVAQGAIDFMVASQDPQRGGWRYRPGAGADTSVTGWFMMAFKSGQLAGLDVPPDTFERIRNYVEASQVSQAEPHLYRYNPFAPDTPQQRHGLKPTAVMTSVGLLMRLYFGWERGRPEMVAGTDYLLQHAPEHGTRSRSRRDTYYWYYATQVLFHMGGDRWDSWHDTLYPLLIEHQVTEGEYEGSWDPVEPTPDLWARYGGRLYVTTMNLLSLEVSYRHLPLYDATGFTPDSR